MSAGFPRANAGTAATPLELRLIMPLTFTGFFVLSVCAAEVEEEQIPIISGRINYFKIDKVSYTKVPYG